MKCFMVGMALVILKSQMITTNVLLVI